MLQFIISLSGLILSSVPIIVLTMKMKNMWKNYILLYIFPFLTFLSMLIYVIENDEVYLTLTYVFQMLFFLNMYRSYLRKELFFSLVVLSTIMDLSLIFSFYFATFNFVEIVKKRLQEKAGSIFVILSMLFFDSSLILQIVYIFQNQNYLNIYTSSLFLFGLILFIIPSLRVVWEKR